MDRRNKGAVVFRNMIFPIWLIWMLPAPQVLIPVLAGNFFIDLTVLYVSMKALKIPEAGKKARKHIWGVWARGFGADVIAAIALFIFNCVDFGSSWYSRNVLAPMHYDVFQSPLAALVMLAFVALGGYLVYRYDYKGAFEYMAVEDRLKKKLAVCMGVFTAPYFFMVPYRVFERIFG